MFFLQAPMLLYRPNALHHQNRQFSLSGQKCQLFCVTSGPFNACTIYLQLSVWLFAVYTGGRAVGPDMTQTLWGILTRIQKCELLGRNIEADQIKICNAICKLYVNKCMPMFKRAQFQSNNGHCPSFWRREARNTWNTLTAKEVVKSSLCKAHVNCSSVLSRSYLRHLWYILSEKIGQLTLTSPKFFLCH